MVMPKWFLGSAVMLPVGLSLVLGTGCASTTDDTVRSDMAGLEQRIADLERGGGRTRAQVDDIEQDILLLEDRVEAQRLSLERRGAVAARTRNELPTYQAPAGERVPARISQLPVERVTPPNPQEIPLRTQAEFEPQTEIVITNQTLNDFTAQNGASMPLPPAAGPTPRSVPAPAALPVSAVHTPSQIPAPRVAAATSANTGVGVYQEALSQFNEGSYANALRGFEQFLAEGASWDYQDNAHYWIGECHYALGALDTALTHFERVVTDYADGNKVPDSLLKIGLTYQRLNNQREASEVLNVLVQTYPLTDAARRASERLTELN